MRGPSRGRHYWDALLDGGRAEQCAWLRGRYGGARQIIPRRLEEPMSDCDKAVPRTTARAMPKMVRIDIAGLERAADASRSAGREHA